MKKCNVIETNCWDSRSIFSLHRLKMSTIVLPTPHQKKGFCGKAQKQRRQESLNKGPKHHAILSIYCLLSIFYHILSSIGCCTGESAINKPTSGKRTAQSAPQLLMRIARHPPQQASASIEHGTWGSSATVGLLMVLGYNML